MSLNIFDDNISKEEIPKKTLISSLNKQLLELENWSDQICQNGRKE